MTVVAFINEETETQYTSDVWADKISVSRNITPGPYIIWASAEYTGSATDKVAEICVLLDDVEVAFEQYVPTAPNLVRIFNSMGLKNLDEGTHSLKIQCRSGTLPNTVRCRRARILLMKH